MHTSTTFEIPGFRLAKSLGIVRGITVQTRSLPMTLIGSLSTLFGGRVGIRYDTGPVVGAAEVLCYGTAVVVEPA